MWQFDHHAHLANNTSTLLTRAYDRPSHRVLDRFTVTNTDFSPGWTGPLIQSESSWLPYYKLTINASLGTLPDQSVVLHAESDF